MERIMRLLSTSIIISILIHLHGVDAFVSPSRVGERTGPTLGKHPYETTRSFDDSVVRYNIYKPTKLNLVDPSLVDTSSILSSLTSTLDMNRDQAEALAGPFFGASLFPYLAFLYLLNVDENGTPKGVTVGFATCLLFVFLTIPAAIAAQLLYGVSLADSDWLHGSAESLLTITNLVTVVAFRQTLRAKEEGLPEPTSATSWTPMTLLVAVLTIFAAATALVPAASGATTVHTPYLAGFMDFPFSFESLGANTEPENAVTIAT